MWLQSALDPGQSVIWLNTQSQCEKLVSEETGMKNDSAVKSKLEADIVYELVAMITKVLVTTMPYAGNYMGLWYFIVVHLQ